MPDVAELQRHTFENLNGYYQGLKVEDEIEKDAKLNADGEVAELAKEAGIDPDKFVNRFETGEPASQELADTWQQDELEDIQKNLTYQDQTEPSDQGEVEHLAKTAYDELHRNALQTYRQAERELEVHRARKKQLRLIARRIHRGRSLESDVEKSLNQIIKDTLHPKELSHLEMGESNTFQHISENGDHQRALSHRYLGAEVHNAEGTRKLHLHRALQKVDREMPQINRALDKDYGLDY